MKKLIYSLGCVVVSVVMYAIPILLCCSFFCNWDAIIKVGLLFLAALQFALLYWVISDELSEDE